MVVYRPKNFKKELRRIIREIRVKVNKEVLIVPKYSNEVRVFAANAVSFQQLYNLEIRVKKGLRSNSRSWSQNEIMEKINEVEEGNIEKEKNIKKEEKEDEKEIIVGKEIIEEDKTKENNVKIEEFNFGKVEEEGLKKKIFETNADVKTEQISFKKDYSFNNQLEKKAPEKLVIESNVPQTKIESMVEDEFQNTVKEKSEQINLKQSKVDSEMKMSQFSTDFKIINSNIIQMNGAIESNFIKNIPEKNMQMDFLNIQSQDFGSSKRNPETFKINNESF
jgi:hypothetical protein